LPIAPGRGSEIITQLTIFFKRIAIGRR